MASRESWKNSAILFPSLAMLVYPSIIHKQTDCLWWCKVAHEWDKEYSLHWVLRPAIVTVIGVAKPNGGR